ncbi:MAG: PorT family protein [Flavobacteriaceae bacterium]|jgi:hypothetical protein|nr:PorT family protein [Flavobacteriaceae bacterium]MBT3753810.1 PorT family protein [Flavobacteriaceae bacterium]MBT3794372.1 PorT family protein [Flavobacteriaceae bacterium]MBT4063160.1 PorT family protein [Flavobacteriaceae bacterium]MBT4246658.1 PorT family protein [Flavobacteriaceae bacterium]
MIKQPSILLFLMFFIAGFCQKNNTKIENLQNFDKQKLHFGYFIGFNQYNYKLDYKINPNYATWIEESIGVNIGLIGDLRINEYINLRFEPGLHTNKLNLRFNERSKFTQNSDTIRSVKSSYIHIPLLIKLSTKRLDNFRPYLIGGVSTSFNLSSNQNSPEDNKNNVFRLKANNLYYELGFGIDFYLQYFKFSPSIRGVFSLKDELVPDDDVASPWTGNIENLSTRGFFINLTFH